MKWVLSSPFHSWEDWVSEPAQGSKGSKWQSKDLNPGLSASKAPIMFPITHSKGKEPYSNGFYNILDNASESRSCAYRFLYPNLFVV